jgi:FtsP/CotA-like multicopper oxidase with cupredoxin domain
VQAKDHIINLTVTYKTVNFAGKDRCAIAVNNQIPAPKLHFKQGDHVKINVHNNLDKDTAIHWHGIILPWQMDGVEGVTQKGIMPGKTFTYEFNLEQSGTYWYHAHAGLQEQEGLYGAFVIDPPDNNQFQYSKYFAIVLTDWSNTN